MSVELRLGGMGSGSKVVQAPWSKGGGARQPRTPTWHPPSLAGPSWSSRRDDEEMEALDFSVQAVSRVLHQIFQARTQAFVNARQPGSTAAGSCAFLTFFASLRPE